MTSSRTCSSGIALTLLVAAAPAAAQQQSSLEEIIVSATKRGLVSVQDIPAGVSAVSGDFLADQNLRTLEDVVRFAPSLQLAKQASGDLQPVIRGIQSPGAGTVGVYFDETVITGLNPQDGGGRTPDIGAYDIARVEVLKGPQGTLFGASSMSGTLRLISNKPDPADFDANLSIRGNDLEDGETGYGADGMVNIPLGDSFALRGVGWYEERGGFIDEYAGLNAVTKTEDANEVERFGGRLMARWQPSDRVTVDAFGLYQELNDDGPQGFAEELTGNSVPITIVAGPDEAIGDTVLPPFVGVAGERIMTTPVSEFNDSQIEMYGATAEFKVGAGSIVATVSKYTNDNFSVTDTTGTATRFFLLDPGVGPDVPGVTIPEFGGLRFGVTTPFSLQQTQDREVLSSEVRYSSDFEGPLNFVTGVYYEEDDQATETMVVSADPVTGLALCDTHAQCIADPTSAAAQTLVFGTDEITNNEAYALFGHADFDLTDAWTLGAGVRYYEADLRNRNFTLQRFQGSNPFELPPRFGGDVQTTPIEGLDETTSQDKVTWDASLSYRQSEDVLYYLRGATGFRQGGINDSNSAQQLGIEIPETYEPDTVLSIELGAKTSWADDRVILNSAIFRMDWEDIQVPGQDPTGSVNFIGNAAEAQIDGIELELYARPTDQWFLTFAMTWLDAALTKDQVVDDPLGLGFPAGKDGDKIPKVPEWALSGSAEFTFPFWGSGDLETALRANFSYVDESTRFLNDSFENNATLGDYWLLNVGAGVRGENWEFRLFVNNVTDEAAVLDVFGNGADPQHTITVEPRAIGAELMWRYR